MGKFTKDFDKDIQTFLKTPNKGKLQVVFETGEPSLGIGVTRGKSGTWDSTKVYVMVIKDSSEKGYHIQTSFPTLSKEMIR